MNSQSLTVKTAIRERRSIKLFNGQPVDPQDLMEIFDDAKWAPNHGNRQPWRIVLATGEGLTKLVEVIREFAVPNWKEISEDELSKKLAKFTAPGAMAIVIAAEDLRQKERLEDYAAVSSFIQNSQLLAWDRGIGACWKTPGFLEKPEFSTALNIQAGERPIALLQFGYFDVIPKEKAKKAVEEFVTIFGE
ncbi:nitroreductase family protein [Kurthia sibirica]|uniref:Nitroreductase n=1 Tax=Kurthia sibirica TaxID=202750 RepID=A0A2U3AQ19_9BACL|nr:nitroreductase [Kurthia sibirica]PWI26555.1 nitroreductase [Kurthia sibirica]GEK32805.1 nitroreductase [Kurthia sibirica]